ncbi:MAG: PilX N-terminal domain-containing pilus assembly protein [Gammaproteobacteria bacterium]|nr:PilX N-terminal domain-containing pilus assembly protein [Gammaproteobacteria bacterium]
MKQQAEKGAVLVISLIMLVVLTLLGITAMQSTTLEEKMAGNLKDRNLAFQAAEGAAILAEKWLSGKTNLPIEKSDGSAGIWVYNSMDSDAANGVPWWLEADRDASWWAANGGDGETVIAMGAGLNSQPSYVIEKLPLTTGPSLQAGSAMHSNNLLRVTARGVGGTESAVVVLQTTYKW